MHAQKTFCNIAEKCKLNLWQLYFINMQLSYFQIENNNITIKGYMAMYLFWLIDKIPWVTIFKYLIIYKELFLDCYWSISNHSTKIYNHQQTIKFVLQKRE